MIFRSAHRIRAWGSPSRDVRLYVACAALPLMVMAAPGLAACGRPGGRVHPVGVDQRLDIALSDGRTVRLGGLDVPNADRGAPEIASAAHDFLSRRLVGREADLIVLAGAPDRWGRTVADLSLADPDGGADGSTAAALLAAGLARVRPEFETRGCAVERLAIEDSARRAALGIWRDPDFAVIQSSDLAELRRRDGRFVVIEGIAGESHLEFGGDIGWVLRFGWDGFYRVAMIRGAGECFGSLYRMLGRFGRPSHWQCGAA
jgi:endonuclease YncB( thermonuclease family)